MMHLLQAHGFLQKIEFLLSLRALYDAHVKLNAWGSAMGAREVFTNKTYLRGFVKRILILDFN